jgi:hypothetical protein
LRRDTESGKFSTQVAAAKQLPAPLWKNPPAIAATVIVLAAGLAAGWFHWHTTPPKSPRSAPTQQRLTTNSSENAVSASAISPDGKYLECADKSGIYLRLMATGEIHALVAKGYDVTSLGWFPDRSQLFASWATPPENKLELWTLSILGGAPRKLSDEGWAASVSPDGSRMVFLKKPAFRDTGQEIWLMKSSGGDEKKLVSAAGNDLSRDQVGRQAHPLVIDFGSTQSRDRVNKLERLFFGGLGSGFERSVRDQQSHRMEIEFAICGSGRKCTRAVSGQQYFTFLGHRIAKYLAIPAPTTGSNVWMVEGF